MRFHQAVAFLPTDQVLELGRAADAMGYAGIYVSDHIFYPRDLRSRYTYSPHEDGSPVWSPETDWPDPWCLISALAAVTTNLELTTGVYIAPARDLFTVAKLVSTAAVISDNRVRLGVQPARDRRSENLGRFTEGDRSIQGWMRTRIAASVRKHDYQDQRRCDVCDRAADAGGLPDHPAGREGTDHRLESGSVIQTGM